jgi:hypothetical protein
MKPFRKLCLPGIGLIGLVVLLLGCASTQAPARTDAEGRPIAIEVLIDGDWNSALSGYQTD